MVLMESFRVPLGTPAYDFSLLDVSGREFQLADFAEAKVLVIIFMCNHCPYVKACAERLVNLQKDFLNRDVQFVAINSNDSTDYPEDSFEAMQEFVKEYHLNFPYLHDERQRVAKMYRAMCTPDIFVYDAQRKLQYHGRIDDNWKDPSRVKRQDLREAIEVMLFEGRVAEVQYPSMGCSIKWKN